MAADADRREQIELLHARIASLRREVYSRSGAEAPQLDAVDPVTGELLHLTAAERRLLAAERELREAEGALRPPSPPRDRPDDAATPELEVRPAANPVAAGGPRRARRVSVPLVAAVVAVTIAAGFFTLGRAASGGGNPPSAPTRPGGALPRLGTSPGLDIFDIPQQPEDIPAVLLGFGVDPTSTRSFGNFGSSPDVAHTYVARTISGLICLAIVLPDQTSSMTCVTANRYAAEGIRLRLTTAEMVQSPEAGGPPQAAFYEYYWSRDGNLSLESNVLHFPSAPHA